MIIEKECVVAMNFTVKDEEDNVLESSPAEEPLVYLHGAGNLVIGLERGLKGMKVGDKETIIVYPEEGFGEAEPALKVKADKSMFPPDINLEVDRVLERDDGGEKTRYRVVKVEGDTIFLDGNHPMAGKTLHYSVDIVSIRQATDDELEKGHPEVIVH